MAKSLVEPDVVRFVDQVSMLTSSAQSLSELKVSSHTPGRPLPLKLGGGLERCKIDGKCALERRFGKGFCDLARLNAEGCEVGDCMRISPGKEQALGIQEVLGDVCESSVVRSSALGR